MTTTQMIIGIAVIVFVLLLVLFPEFRKLFSGLVRLFVKDMATTPEGAEAIYEEKIYEAEEAYKKADNALRLASGKLSNARKEMESLKRDLAKVEKECEALASKKDWVNAEIKAEQREDIMSSMKRTETLIEAFAQAEKEARQVHTHCQKKLQALKRESKDIVENMRVKKQLQEVYDDMDELKTVTSTDKLLEQVKEKNKDLNASVEGARVIHENKLSTKIHKADEAARKAQSNDYLESLKKKYK